VFVPLLFEEIEPCSCVSEMSSSMKQEDEP